MAKEFSARGIPSAAVYSNANGEFSEDRASAIRRLIDGKIKVIFSVDMFNEGVDIPSVDMVMFLRPTESPIVFLQQLGRGLRKSRGKEFLNVLDFIGNYEKAGRVRFLLTGGSASVKSPYDPADRSNFPDDCLIDFDMKLIDLFQEMDKKQMKLRDRIRGEFYRVKELLGHTPSRMELFTYMDDDVYQSTLGNARENLFKKYLEYRKQLDELTEDEKLIYNSIGREFISLIENTNMTKVYKMPVLMAFCDKEKIRRSVTEEQLLASWKEFFRTGTNWKDLEAGSDYETFCGISDSEHIRKIMKMPVHFLLQSGKVFFVQKDGAALALREELSEVAENPVFAEEIRDVIQYRAMDYYKRRYRKSETL